MNWCIICRCAITSQNNWEKYIMLTSITIVPFQSYFTALWIHIGGSSTCIISTAVWITAPHTATITGNTMSTDTVKCSGLTTVCTPPSCIAICRQSMIHLQIKLRILITSIHYYENIVPCCDAGWDFDPICSVWGYVFFVLFLSIFVYCNLNSLCRLTVTRPISQEM